MRKILLSILVLLLLLLGGYTVINKLAIGSLEILGIIQIKNENEKLDTKISEASKLASSDYQTQLSNLNKSLKTLQKEKQSYEDLVVLSNSDEVANAAKFEKYEIEYIWAKVGNHATSEGVVMKLEVTRGSSSAKGLYDLKFTVTGDYIGISDFIYDIENDTSLGFKIDGFKLQPGENVDSLTGTFICKDISINIDESTLNSQNNQSENNGAEGQNSENTNSTNTVTNNTNTTSSSTNTVSNSTNTTSNSTTTTN